MTPFIFNVQRVEKLAVSKIIVVDGEVVSGMIGIGDVVFTKDVRDESALEVRGVVLGSSIPKKNTLSLVFNLNMYTSKVLVPGTVLCNDPMLATQ